MNHTTKILNFLATAVTDIRHAIVLFSLGSLLTWNTGANAAETLSSINAELQTNFHFVRQNKNDKPRLVSGLEPFRGDCDDLAFAAYGRLRHAGFAPKIWIVKPIHNTQLHMVTCYDGECIDSKRRETVTVSKLKIEYKEWRRAVQSEAWIEKKLAL